MQKKDVFNIPNILSFVRIILIVPLILFALKENYTYAFFVLALSGISDFLDGFFARKLELVTTLGKMLDPIADKLTLGAVMVVIAINFPSMLPFMIVLIVKELIMLICGAILLKKNLTPPPARWFGKLATVVFYLSSGIIILLKAIWNYSDWYLNFWLMLLTVLAMIFAAGNYFQIFLSMIKNRKIFPADESQRRE